MMVTTTQKPDERGIQMPEMFPIPISKAGKNLPVDKEALEALFDSQPEVYRAVVLEGLKVFLNKGMSKITGLKDMDEDELEEAHEAAFEIAQKNWAALKEGNLKTRRAGSGSKLSREQTTFLNNEAKALIKASFKQHGKKLPAKASAITQAAKDYNADPDNAEWVAGKLKEFAAMKAKAAPIEVTALTGALKDMLDKAEAVKPRVPPKRKKKENGDKAPAGLVAAAKTKGRPEGGGVRAH